ncbi:hypothetical protein E2C01_094831 [Portunus trituberculatus]|uniref:Regucalcin n=1 Tax=Portunus trituberculatus TaxID=210409 RepID=A0A5B7K2Q5_PORTR|nr:hypothetical protein [Portunus trituberculatus]
MVMPVEGEDQVYMVGLGKTLSVVRWPKGVTDSRPVKLQVVYRTEDPHMNDGKCDGKGRLWFGECCLSLVYPFSTVTHFFHEFCV